MVPSQLHVATLDASGCVTQPSTGPLWPRSVLWRGWGRCQYEQQERQERQELQEQREQVRQKEQL